MFWILAQEQKHPVFKRADVLKSIGIVQKSQNLREDLWNSIARDLKRIFGYILRESTQKKGEYYLFNSIPDGQNEKLKHLVSFKLKHLTYHEISLNNF